MRDRLPPNVVPGELIDHTLDRLRPGVVDCEDLEVGIGLPGHGGQATPQDRSRRVDGDQHADSRRHGDLHLSGPVYRAEPSGERSDPNWRVTCGRSSAAKVARSLTGVAFPTNVSLPICQRTRAFVAQEIHAGGFAAEYNTWGRPRSSTNRKGTSEDPFGPNSNGARRRMEASSWEPRFCINSP